MPARVDDEPILRMLAGGSTVTETAAALGISATTIYARLREPTFIARVQEMRAQGLAPAEKALVDTVLPSIATLHEIANGFDSNGDRYDAKARSNAASKLIDLALKVKAEVQVLPRVAVLEAMMRDKGREAPLAVPEGE